MTEKFPTQAAAILQQPVIQICDGRLTAGAKLPSERDLSELFSTTRITLKQAFLRLEAESCITSENRRSWFVTPPRLEYNPITKSHFHLMVER